MHFRKSPSLLLTLAMLCWAGNWVVGRAIHEQVPPLALLGIAFLGERFAWHHAAGVAGIALGLYLTSAAQPSVAKPLSS